MLSFHVLVMEQRRLLVPLLLACSGGRPMVHATFASQPAPFRKPAGSQSTNYVRGVSTDSATSNTAKVLKRVLTRRAVRLDSHSAKAASPLTTHHHSATFISKSRDTVVEQAKWSEIEALLQAGSIQQAQDMLRTTCWDPRTQLPQSENGWRLQLEIYRILKNNKAAFAAIYEELPRCGIRPTAAMFESAIAASCAKKEVDQAMQLLRDMQRRQLEPSDRCHTAILRCLVSIDRQQDALNMFKQLSRGGRKNTSAQYHVFIEHYIRIGDIKRAVALMEDMAALNLLPSVTSIAAVAQFGLQKSPQLTSDKIMQSIQIFESMCDHFKLTNWSARKASEFYYAFLLDIILAHPELPKQLTKVICDRARARHVVFSAVFLNAAMTAYIEAGQIGHALGMFQMHVQQREFRGATSYVESSGASASKRTIAILPDDKTLRLLIRISQIRHQPNMAMFYWRFFSQRNIPTSTSSLSALISVLAQFGEVDAASQLASGRDDIDSPLMAGLISMAVSSQKYDVAEELILSTKQRGLPMTGPLGTTMIEYYNRVDRPDDAYEVWGLMKQAKCITPRAAGTMIRLVGHYAGIKYAEAIHDEYLSLGYRPTRRLSYMMLRTYAWLGSFTQALLYLDRSQNELGIQPTFLHFSRLLKEAARQRELGPLFQIFEYMYRRSDFVFTKEFCERVILICSSYRVGGAQREDRSVAMNWLHLAAKPKRIGGGRLLRVIEGADRHTFFQMVQGWANNAMQRPVPADARPVAPMTPRLLQEQQQQQQQQQQNSKSEEKAMEYDRG